LWLLDVGVSALGEMNMKTLLETLCARQL